jgi:hypothetical protein
MAPKACVARRFDEGGVGVDSRQRNVAVCFPHLRLRRRQQLAEWAVAVEPACLRQREEDGAADSRHHGQECQASGDERAHQARRSRFLGSRFSGGGYAEHLEENDEPTRGAGADGDEDEAAMA